MDTSSTSSSRSMSSCTTPCHVYSPLPIRSPARFGLSVDLLSDLSSKTNSKPTNSTPGPKFIYKKFMELAKEDLETGNRVEFFPRSQCSYAADESSENEGEELATFDFLARPPSRASNPQVLDKMFERDEFTNIDRLQSISNQVGQGV